MFGNIFKPIFFGKFQTQDNKVFLVGTFKMGLVAQLIVWFSVIMGLVTQIVALPSIGTGSGFEALSFLEPTIFVGAGVLVVLSCKVPAKRDVAWIKHQIERALTVEKS